MYQSVFAETTSLKLWILRRVGKIPFLFFLEKKDGYSSVFLIFGKKGPSGRGRLEQKTIQFLIGFKKNVYISPLFFRSKKHVGQLCQTNLMSFVPANWKVRVYSIFSLFYVLFKDKNFRALVSFSFNNLNFIWPHTQQGLI